MKRERSKCTLYMQRCLPVVDGVGGAILVDYQSLVHAREHSLVVGRGQRLSIRPHPQSASCHIPIVTIIPITTERSSLFHPLDLPDLLVGTGVVTDILATGWQGIPVCVCVCVRAVISHLQGCQSHLGLWGCSLASRAVEHCCGGTNTLLTTLPRTIT